MKLQTLLLGTAGLAMFALSGCATSTQAQETVMADEHVVVKTVKMEDGHTWMSHEGGDAKTFVFKSDDGHMVMDMKMDVDVQTDENGATVVMINGEKVDGDAHVWKSKDGKDMKMKVKRMAMNKDMKGHKKQKMMVKRLHAEGDGKSIFVIKGDEMDGEIMDLLVDSKHSRKIIKRLHKMVDGEDGMRETQMFAFIGGDEDGHEDFPHTIDLENGMQIFVEKGGNVKVMKDGKIVEAAAHNMNVDKSVTMENGKRKTKIIIEMIEDE